MPISTWFLTPKCSLIGLLAVGELQFDKIDFLLENVLLAELLCLFAWTQWQKVSGFVSRKIPIKKINRVVIIEIYSSKPGKLSGKS